MDSYTQGLIDAAEQGDKEATSELAISYSLGLGVKIDTKKAVQLHRLAAVLGVEYSQHELGLYYYKGMHGVEKHTSSALYWFKKAALKGYERSKEALVQMFEDGAIWIDEIDEVEGLKFS